MESRFKRIASAVVGKSCPICLCRLKDRRSAVVIPCMHAYCISCIRRWSEVKRKCPMCNADFDSWFSRISLWSRTFQKEKISAYSESKKLDSVVVSSRPRNRLSDRRVIRRTREELSTFGSRTRPFPSRRSFGPFGALNSDDIAGRIIRWRASIYEERLRAVPFASKICLMQHMDDRGAKEKMIQRIEPWIRRELQAVLGDSDPSVIVHVVTSLFVSETAHSTRQCVENDFLAPLRPFLHEHVETFWHELRCFAESPLSMQTYDTVVEYKSLD